MLLKKGIELDINGLPVKISKSGDMDSSGDKKKIKGWYNNLKDRIHHFAMRLARLQGDPHYIALGLAIGVFISATPTIPFHTALGVGLAFIFKGSKPAAAIGVWLSNPVTIPFFYIASYKTGAFLIGSGSSDKNVSIMSLLETFEGHIPLGEKFSIITGFITQNVEIAYSLILGGFIIGIPPAVLTYFLTKRIISIIHLEKIHLRRSGKKHE